MDDRLQILQRANYWSLEILPGMNNTSPALREHSYRLALENSGYLAKSGLSTFSTSDLVPEKFQKRIIWIEQLALF